MCQRVVTRCKNRKCKQSFGVVKLLKNNRAECPFCHFHNALGKRQIKKF